jgi:hypothetical protein
MCWNAGAVLLKDDDLAASDRLAVYFEIMLEPVRRLDTDR